MIWFLDRHDVKTKTIENSVCWQHLQKFKCIQKTSHFLFIALPSVTTSQYGKRTRGKKSQKKKKKSTECIEIKKKTFLINIYNATLTTKNCKWNSVQRQSWIFPQLSSSSSFMHFVGQLPIRLFCLFFDERNKIWRQSGTKSWVLGTKKLGIWFYTQSTKKRSSQATTLICKHESLIERWVTDASLGGE